jgi:hypothetical protein
MRIKEIMPEIMSIHNDRITGVLRRGEHDGKIAAGA